MRSFVDVYKHLSSRQRSEKYLNTPNMSPRPRPPTSIPIIPTDTQVF